MQIGSWVKFSEALRGGEGLLIAIIPPNIKLSQQLNVRYYGGKYIPTSAKVSRYVFQKKDKPGSYLIVPEPALGEITLLDNGNDDVEGT